MIDAPGGSVAFPPSGVLPRVVEGEVTASPQVHDQVELPVWQIDPGEVLGLPDPVASTWLIVSRAVALAARNRPDLLVPHRQRPDASGMVVGCAGLAHLAPVPGAT